MPAIQLSKCPHCQDTGRIRTRFDATEAAVTGIIATVRQCPYCRMNHEHCIETPKPAVKISSLAGEAIKQFFTAAKEIFRQ